MKKKALTQDDPQFLPVQYSLTDERIIELKNWYAPKNIPMSEVKGDEGYKLIHDRAMDIRKIRTNIENVRKDLKRDALAWGKKVDGEAKRLTGIVKAIEQPWSLLKAELDEADEMRQEEERIAEMERMQTIEGKIDALRAMALVFGLSAEALAIEVGKVQSMIITEHEFEEYFEAAQITRDQTLEKLEHSYTERKTFEDARATMRAEKKKMAEVKAELKQQKKEIDAGRKALKEAQEALAATEKPAPLHEDPVPIVEQGATGTAQKAQKPDSLSDMQAAYQLEVELVKTYVADLFAVPRPSLVDEDLRGILSSIHHRLIEIDEFAMDAIRGES